MATVIFRQKHESPRKGKYIPPYHKWKTIAIISFIVNVGLIIYTLSK